MLLILVPRSCKVTERRSHCIRPDHHHNHVLHHYHPLSQHHYHHQPQFHDQKHHHYHDACQYVSAAEEKPDTHRSRQYEYILLKPLGCDPLTDQVRTQSLFFTVA